MVPATSFLCECTQYTTGLRNSAVIRYSNLDMRRSNADLRFKRKLCSGDSFLDASKCRKVIKQHSEFNRKYANPNINSVFPFLPARSLPITSVISVELRWKLQFIHLLQWMNTCSMDFPQLLNSFRSKDMVRDS